MQLRRSVLLTAGLGLLLLGVGLSTANDRARLRADQDRRLLDEATVHAEAVGDYFERAREILLVSAQNQVFADFHAEEQATGTASAATRRRVESALQFLQTLFPDQSVSELCLIAANGVEQARVVGTHIATAAELSVDEGSNPFFAPTFELAPGNVFQAAPYISPDTHAWVISNSTPLDLVGGAPSLLHFEVSLDAFRARLDSPDGVRTVVLDRATGAVVLDSERPTAGDPLPGTRRYPGADDALGGGGPAGLMTIGDERVAYRHIVGGTGNVNDWVVLTSAPAAASSILSGFGLIPTIVLLASLLVIGFVVASFRASQRDLRTIALTDQLTALPNRTLLYDRIEHGLHINSRNGTDAAVLMIDLDRFKEVNDTMGHHRGDELLAEVGRRLRAAVRASDTVARLGGDEFAVFLTGMTRGDEARITAERIVEAVSRPVALGGVPVQVGASVGIAISPDDGEDVDLLMQHADLAMYEAKRMGSGYRFYDSKARLAGSAG